MFSIKSQWTALMAGLALAVSPIMAGEAGPLLDALVRKGILSDQEAEDLRADLSRESQEFVMASVSAGKSTNSVALNGRLQLQYAGLNSDQNVAGTNQLFMRRIYFGMNAGIGPDWTANFLYDFAGGGFDKAFVEWSGYLGSEAIALDFGLRKVNFGYEETTSSGSLKAIERSPVTRFFVEPNNGRRLGAGSYRVGVFADGGSVDVRKGKSTGLFYGAALTTQTRIDGFGDASADGIKYSGSGTNGSLNSLAMWANVGYSKVLSPASKFVVGAAYGLLPDMGGASNTNFGKGHDITEYSLYFDYTAGAFNLSGEYLSATVDGALAGGTKAAKPSGYWIQPSFAVSEKLELVARYSEVDADGRNIRASDGIRSAPAARTGQQLEEFYLGLNYYLINQDVKLQLGYINGKLSDGGSEKVDGLRSQLQVNF
ncbi:MAG: porin [Opitutaceae bacterium]|nr:porin [Opitutaceae bacterium]